jgi:hypothetical protein
MKKLFAKLKKILKSIFGMVEEIPTQNQNNLGPDPVKDPPGNKTP